MQWTAVAMDQAKQKVRVSCRWCGLRFSVEVQGGEDWDVEAQCPCCDCWHCFNIADTRCPPAPDPLERRAATQRLGEELWRPINEHRSHPAVEWFEKVGNGMFEDDYSSKPWHTPHFWVYRFRRGNEAAYLWQDGETWFVRCWHPLRGRQQPPEPTEVYSFEAGLDRLIQL
jgi:hypothetical protein